MANEPVRNYNLTFLGTGTSIGIPVPGCRCAVCKSRDSRNRRMRSSILLESEGTRILIDTSPEFRLQVLAAGIDSLDAVFWTHSHADHLHGLDDLRALSWKEALPGYASGTTVDEIHRRFNYLWKQTQRGGGKARLNLQAVEPGTRVPVNQLEVIPVPVFHGELPIYGWRCGPAAYLTDVSRIPDESYALLEKLEILVVGALRFKTHPTHFTVERALEEIEKIRPKRAYLTHISHDASHRRLKQVCPPHVRPAKDGLRLRAVEALQ